VLIHPFCIVSPQQANGLPKLCKMKKVNKSIVILAISLFSVGNAFSQFLTAPDGNNLYTMRRVGFGTNTPKYGVHVFGDDTYGNSATIMIDRYHNGGYGGFLRFRSSPHSATVAARTLGSLVFEGSESYSNDVNVYGTGAQISVFTTENWSANGHGSRFNFYTVENGSTTKELRMSIDHDGKVAIGSDLTTPDGYRLFVEDGILTEKIQVAIKNTSNWSDFVFADDYELKGLGEVEQFISENKHLPGVPSANAMVSEGLNVAKMDALLLQKVEELTLYMIELEKKVEMLEAQK